MQASWKRGGGSVCPGTSINGHKESDKYIFKIKLCLEALLFQKGGSYFSFHET